MAKAEEHRPFSFFSPIFLPSLLTFWSGTAAEKDNRSFSSKMRWDF